MAENGYENRKSFKKFENELDNNSRSDVGRKSQQNDSINQTESKNNKRRVFEGNENRGD